MKKNNKVLEALIWLLLIVLTFTGLYGYCWYSGLMDVSDKNTLVILGLVSIFPMALLKISDMNKPDASKQAQERIKAQHTSNIPKEYYRDKPRQGDLILGEANGKYICTSIEKTDSHYSIIGTSGTGKTSAYLLNNLILNDNIGALILDVKDSELFRKSTKYGDERVLRFDPSIRSNEVCGFDPFYLLSAKKRCTDAEALETMQLVCNSLISISAHEKDPFWKQNARNMFLGFLIFYYKQGKHDLVSIVDEILSKPIAENVEYVLEHSDPTEAHYRYLIMFSNMAEQTISGIYSEMASHLTVFSNNPGIRYAFGRGSARKITPLDLEDGKRIFLCIDQTQIATLDGCIKMILDVMMYGLQTRMRGKEESEVKPVLFIIDELPQLLMNGPLSQLIQGLRVLRSSKVRMILAYQTRESLLSAYTEAQATDLMSNTNHLIVLNGGNSTATLKFVCDLVGQFKEKQTSYQSGKNKSTSVNFSNSNILEPGDINKLPLENKALILSPTGWMMIKKSPYYKCKYIAPKAEEIRHYNKNIEDLHQHIEQQPEEIDPNVARVYAQIELWKKYKLKTTTEKSKGCEIK